MKAFYTLEELDAMPGVGRREKLLALADEAKEGVAHVVSISNFKVAAVALTSKGVFCGVNTEGRGMEYTMHAEQSMIHHVLSKEALGDGISVVAVTAAPCGLCRQLLSELFNAKQCEIVTPDGSYLLSDLLPAAFSPETVGKPCLGCVPKPSFGPSQASWTESPAAVTLTFPTRIVTGYFLESVAHNPTVPAITGAVNLSMLEGLQLKDCSAAKLTVLKEKNGADKVIDHTVAMREGLAVYLPQLKGEYTTEEV